ncbi:unnamed protein product, partial [Rhizopus stolonifer]
ASLSIGTSSSSYVISQNSTPNPKDDSLKTTVQDTSTQDKPSSEPDASSASGANTDSGNASS